MTYRREIDGLRALAVVAVILYHAGFESFAGGFVGVDVFFVISGYLITSIILTEQNSKRFTLVGFYERRARRILPALFVVMLACLPFAWLWMTPSDLKTFSASLVAVSTFASNILFFRESGYFDSAVELKPLIHTWSLAVEEQYYVLFPIFILATWRLGKKRITWCLIVIGVASLAAAQWGSRESPDATFYLLPTRGWELLIGALIAIYLLKNDSNAPLRNIPIRQLLSLLGLSLVLYSIFEFDKSTPFPSLYALLPTVGTGLMVLFAQPSTLVGSLLSTRLLVGLGLISYSAYLWHQPLFVFARIYLGRSPSTALLLLLSAITLGLAYLAWRYIEMPMRDKTRVNRTVIFTLALVFSLGFSAVGLIGYAHDGFESRLSSAQRAVASFSNYDHASIYRQGLCFLGSDQNYRDFASVCKNRGANATAIVLWGDSHAAALSSGLILLAGNVAQFTASACPPLLGVTLSARPNCEAINRYVVEQIKQLRPKGVFLHADWAWYTGYYKSLNLTGALDHTIKAILKVSPTTKVIVIGSVPQWNPTLPVTMLRESLTLTANAKASNATIADQKVLDNQLRLVAVQNDVSFASAIDELCDGINCQAVAQIDGKLEPTAWDYGHLTEAGSAALAGRLLADLTSRGEL
jgi:peptidoglycan/LPS O-acetylase OafA/YrhL